MSEERENRSSPGDLPEEELLSGGTRALEWIARYLEGIREYPVMAPVREGHLLDSFPERMPEEGEPLERIEKDFREKVLPGVTHWNHPRFFAYFSISGSIPGILGELYAAALNTNGMKWITCPASAELEKGVLRWLRNGLGLPSTFEGILADAASTSSLLSLAVARERATGFRTRTTGLYREPARHLVYASEEAHSSVEKAALLLGIGTEGVRKIPSDEKYRMSVPALREAIRRDRGSGGVPIAVVATAGTTATTSVDPVSAIADVAEEEGLWLHVDGAYAGVTALLEEKRNLFRGWERADTVVVNPHKWLFVPIDASAFFFRDPATLKRAFSIVPEYLRTTDDADNPMDYGFQLGRRFRALKLWFVLRAFGRKGIEERLRFHIHLARELASRIDDHPEWERLAPTPFSTVCFRYRGGGGRTEEELAAQNGTILERINRSGDAYISHAVLKERYALRLALGNIRTTGDDVKFVWERLQEEASGLSSGGSSRRPARR